MDRITFVSHLTDDPFIIFYHESIHKTSSQAALNVPAAKQQDDPERFPFQLCLHAPIHPLCQFFYDKQPQPGGTFPPG